MMAPRRVRTTACRRQCVLDRTQRRVTRLPYQKSFEFVRHRVSESRKGVRITGRERERERERESLDTERVLWHIDSADFDSNKRRWDNGSLLSLTTIHSTPACHQRPNQLPFCCAPHFDSACVIIQSGRHIRMIARTEFSIID